MRVLKLTADYPPDTWSGIGVAVQGQARHLLRLGVDVEVLTPCETAAETGSVRVHRLRRDAFALDPCRFDLVHLHSLSLAELALELCRRHDLPLVYTAHAMVHLELPEGPTARHWSGVQQRLFAAADRVIVLNRQEHREAVQMAPRLRNRCGLIPNGVAPLAALPARASSWPTEAPLLFAGRFAPSKGLELLLDLIPRLVERDASTRFLMVGGHGDPADHRRLAALSRRFPDNMAVLDWQPHSALRALMQGACALLMPSRYEPFGMCALEAMQLGTPVVGSDVGGLSDLLAPGSGGLRVPPSDVHAWLGALRDLRGDRALHQRLSRQGPPWVARYFNADQAAASVFDLYQRVTQSAPVSPC